MDIEHLQKYSEACRKLEERIQDLNKQINDTTVDLKNVEGNEQLEKVLSGRLKMMEEEREYLIKSSIELRDTIGKLTFNNYNITVDDNEFREESEDLEKKI